MANLTPPRLSSRELAGQLQPNWGARHLTGVAIAGRAAVIVETQGAPLLELACAGEPRFVPSRLEEGREKSYSIHTIERVKAMNGEVFFVIGADAFAEIRKWHRWEDVVKAVDFIVVARPGHVYTYPPGARVHRLETVALPVSSSEVRQALARGERPEDLPEAVAEYIRTHRLYSDMISRYDT